MHSMKRFILAALTLGGIGLTSQHSHAQMVIGSFDATRGGIYNTETGSQTTNFRTQVATNFPGTTYSSTSTLTPAFLSGINVLAISAVFSGTTGISPLSSSEQTALLNFIQAGGRALLFTDNDLQFGAASISMVSPFGLNTTGNIPGATTATVTNGSHPITNGPFGSITTINYNSFPSWYTTLGANAIELARQTFNNEISLAVINPGVLNPGSGAVVFFADSTIDNFSLTGNTVTLVNNALAFVAVPEPSSILMLGSAAVVGGIGAFRYRRKKGLGKGW
ncbi:MAG TPA: PEP-CTERM sorting domain-containing protein [Gemmatales bacterium]|nr:PEP-CTERM sorting domain-containing protein [Gemmatales bacterium]